MNIKLTEKELKYLIETLEINEDFYKESIKEEQERGNEPSDFDVTMLDLLTRLQELRGDFWWKNNFRIRQFHMYNRIKIWYNIYVRKNK